MVQNLKLRMCILKMPLKGAVQVHTITIPPYHFSEKDLESLLLALIKRIGKPVFQKQEPIREQTREGGEQAPILEVTDYEPIESVRQQITGFQLRGS